MLTLTSLETRILEGQLKEISFLLLVSLYLEKPNAKEQL